MVNNQYGWEVQVQQRSGSTPFGLYDTDSEFQTESSNNFSR